MKEIIQISEQDLCTLFKLEAMPTYGNSVPYSKISFSPLFTPPKDIIKTSCVEIANMGCDNFDVYVLNQFLPAGRGFNWNSYNEDLKLSLFKRNGMYLIDRVVAFSHDYGAVKDPEATSLIFNTAVECVKDVVGRDQTRYQEDRFSQLKGNLKEINLRSKQSESHHLRV